MTTKVGPHTFALPWPLCLRCGASLSSAKLDAVGLRAHGHTPFCARPNCETLHENLTRRFGIKR